MGPWGNEWSNERRTKPICKQRTHACERSQLLVQMLATRCFLAVLGQAPTTMCVCICVWNVGDAAEPYTHRYPSHHRTTHMRFGGPFTWRMMVLMGTVG